MSNLMHKVKDALTGHHNNSNSRMNTSDLIYDLPLLVS